MLRRAPLFGFVLLVACSSDEFANPNDAAVDALSADGGANDAAVDAARTGCVGYVGGGFCDDFDVAKDGAADLDPRWLIDTTKGAITRSTQQARSAPGSLLSSFSQTGVDARAQVTYRPNAATANRILVQFSARVDAECGTSVQLPVAALSGVNAGVTQRAAFALVILPASLGGPKLAVLSAVSDLDGGNAAFPEVFPASAGFPFDVWVDLKLDLRVELGDKVHVRLFQAGTLVLDKATVFPAAVHDPGFSVGLETKPRPTACSAFFDDVLIEATP